MIKTETAGSFHGADIYCGGKIIGRLTDICISTRDKKVKGICGIGSFGIIKSRFSVEKNGIIHFDRNGIIVDKKYISKNSRLTDENGVVSAINTGYATGSIGDVYFNSLEIDSISIKRGFFDDVFYGREIVNIGDVSITDNGIVIFNR